MRTTIDPIPAIISKNAKKDKNVVEKQPTTKKNYYTDPSNIYKK